MQKETAELLREISQSGGQWQHDPAKSDVLRELEEAGYVQVRQLYAASEYGNSALAEHDAEELRQENERIAAKEAQLQAEADKAERKAAKANKT